MKTKINRRSNVGFGYETTPTGEDAYSIELPASPDHTGTIKTVLNRIDRDQFFQSLKGGTFYSTAWFIRVNGQWRKLSDDNWQSPADLLGPYADDEIELDVI